MIKAKTVSSKFWILQENNVKIGEVNTTPHGYAINIKGKLTVFQTLDKLKIKTGIVFLNKNAKQLPNTNLIHGYPTSANGFNAMWNLKTKLPLYTKKQDSKSWFAAGYYSVNIKGKWRVILSPKLIVLERNDYRGPFKTRP